MWSVGVPGASTDRFSTLWFDDDLDGKIKNKNPDTTPRNGGPNDLYDNNDDDAQHHVVWQLLHDKDGDPTRGDFGKVDFDDQATEHGSPPRRAGRQGRQLRVHRRRAGCSNDDGDGCDAEWSDDWEVLFADGTFGCTEAGQRDGQLQWDADGEMGRYVASDHGDLWHRRDWCLCGY